VPAKRALKRLVVIRVAVETELEPGLQVDLPQHKMNIKSDYSAVEDDQEGKFREGNPGSKKPDEGHDTGQGGLAPHLINILAPRCLAGEVRLRIAGDSGAFLEYLRISVEDLGLGRAHFVHPIKQPYQIGGRARTRGTSVQF
jgi:hypothetical protein